MTEAVLLPAPPHATEVAAPARKQPIDAVTLLTIYLVLLFLIPSRLVVPGLGAAGRPSAIFGVGMLLMWCCTRIVPGLSIRARQPLHLVLAVFLLYTFVSWWLAYARGVIPAEGRSADRYVINMLSLLGVALTACDGPTTRARLDALLRRLVWLAGVMAFLGAIEFFLRINVAAYIKIPGLTYNRDLVGVSHRGGGGYNGDLFARVASTALHYIEYGGVLAICLPFALHFALFSPPGWTRRIRWAIVAVIAAGVPFAISRSATLGMVIGLLMLVPVWTKRVRKRALVAGVIALAAFKVVTPGLIGTIRALFTHLGSDPSIQGRTSDYAAVAQFFDARPWLGRGGGTFIPGIYRLLDNQYLTTVLEMGIIGVTLLIIVFLSSVVFGRIARRHGPDQQSRHLGQAIAAAGLISTGLSATFDSFSFPTFSGLVFLITGVAAAHWRLAVVERQPAPVIAGLDREPDVVAPIHDMGRLLPVTARRQVATAGTAMHTA